MTQTATQPTQVTYDGLLSKFADKWPHLKAPFEQAKPKIERGEGAQDLANLFKLEVYVREEPTHYVYFWTGENSGQPFELRLLKPFETTPAPKPTATEAPVEVIEEPEAHVEPEAAQTDAQSPTEALETPAPVPESAPQSKPAEKMPATPSLSPGLFTALNELIGTNTLLMTIAKIDDELTVNVMPFGDDKDNNVSAICVTATPSELDEGFAEVIRVKVEGRKTFAEQVAALKDAEKALADAKKKETEAKNKEAEKKRKETEARKKEAEKANAAEPKEAEKPKAQEALF